MPRRPSDLEVQAPLRTQWPRRPYRVEGGALRPVPGGNDDWYDPFKPGYYGARQKRTGRPLYAILWDLGHKCSCSPYREDRPPGSDMFLWEVRHESDESHGRLIEFAENWGIPGTFQHALRFAEYAEPVTQSEEPTFRVAREGESPAGFNEVRWTPAGSAGTYWYPDMHGPPGTYPENSPEEHARKERERLRAEALRRLVPGRVAGMTVRHSLRDMPLPEYYRPFFPDGDLPTPDSRQLFDSLSEPLVFFGNAVRGIQSAYARCVQAQVSPSAWLDRVIAETFDRHLHSVTPALAVVEHKEENGEKKWEREARHRFPSLLSAIYLMLLRDFTNPRLSLRHCAKEDCGRPLITHCGLGRTARKYCSDKCKNTATARNYRAGKRRKAAEAAKGEAK